MSKENLFFIALIPDRDLREKINFLKNDFAKRFSSSKALKVYPHITLKAPFKCNDNGKEELLSWFSGLRIFQKKFSLRLKDFGAFHNRNNPVVFINPIVTQELLRMQDELIAGFSGLFPGDLHPVDVSFKPHVTIAYRDLTPEMFEKAWKEYQHKSFDAIFDVHALYLLQHDTKKWNLISTCSLEKV
jgi:2'-5' RNA ligase